jgi:hypothetical protein
MLSDEPKREYPIKESVDDIRNKVLIESEEPTFVITCTEQVEKICALPAFVNELGNLKPIPLRDRDEPKDK